MKIRNVAVVTATLEDDGTIPNNGDRPLLVYPQAADGSNGDAEQVARLWEEVFSRNNWKSSWRNGVFPYHHYHSTSHEVLGVYAGWAELQLGGPQGIRRTVRAGDVVVIPAGVAHKKLDSGDEFGVVGAYPGGMEYDMNYGKRDERERALRNIESVPVPDADPLYGPDGPLRAAWNASSQ
jgi:uncharacterized protein YjlB